MALLVVVVIACGVVFQWRKDTPARQLARGKAYAAKNEHRQALIEFKRSLQGEPGQPAVRVLLGNELFSVGEVQAARAEFQRALDGGYPADDVIVPLVRAALKENDLNAVIKLVNDTNVESAPVNAELQTLLGAAYLGQGKEQAGFDAFNSARQFVPAFRPAAIAEARYHMVNGKPDLAAAVIAKVPDGGGDDADLLSLRGDLARLAHDLPEAEQLYEAAVRIDPRNMLVRLNLAQNAMELDRLDVAEQQARVVTQALPKNSKAPFIMATIAYARKDMPSAKAAVERSVELSPKYGPSQLLAGVVARETGDLLQAELHLREAVALDPANTEARRMLAELYLQRHEPARAFETIQPILGTAQSNPVIASLAARSAMQSGDAATASQLFERVVGGQPGDAQAAIVAATLKIASGHEASGIAQLAVAAKAHPDDPEIDVAQVVMQLQLHQADAATAAWRLLAAKQPQNPRTDRLRAMIAVERNDLAGARAALTHASSVKPDDFATTAALVDLDLRERHPDQARTRLESFIAGATQPVDALLLLASIDENSGVPVDAVSGVLKRAEKASPGSLEVARAQAAFAVRHGETDQGALAIRRGLAISPDDQPLLSISADLDQRAGRTDRAVATLTRLVALNHEVPAYTMRLGALQLRDGKVEAALVSYRDVLKRNPTRGDLQASMMTSLLEANRVDEADRLLFDIGQAAPNSSIVAMYDGDVKLARKQLPEAIAAYRQVLIKTPSAAGAVKLSKALDLAKRRGDATVVLDDWLKTHPGDDTAMLYQAERATAQLDYDGAAGAYRKLLDGHPDDPRLLNNLAWALARKNDGTAFDYAKRASALAPDDPDVVDTLAGILIQRGDTAEGMRMLQKVSVLAPQRADLKLSLARAQLAGGQRDTARQTLRDVVRMSPDSAEGKQSRQLLTTIDP